MNSKIKRILELLERNLANGAGGVVVEVVGVEGSGENGGKWREKGLLRNGGKYCALHSISNVGGDRPLPLQGPPGHQTVAVDYFLSIDLEYLKASDPEVTYTTSIIKTKATRCISLKKVTFFFLHLNDIEDMLLLIVQHKLFHLKGSDIVDFIMALRMFTRSLILKRRVEDLQLGVESYQKNIHITKPQKTFPDIEFKEPYTSSNDPPGIVYEDLNKQKRVLRADELYKFSDSTLKYVHDEIHHRVLDFRLDYNPKMPKRK
nr:hypothetical protein [Tanacetum cinerariifolium]